MPQLHQLKVTNLDSTSTFVGCTMECIALDLLGPLPTTCHGNRNILFVWTEAWCSPKQGGSHCGKSSGKWMDLLLWSSSSCAWMLKIMNNVRFIHSTRLSECGWYGVLLVSLYQAIYHKQLLLMAYQASVHDTTKFTPFHLMFEREIRLPIDLMFGKPWSGTKAYWICQRIMSLPGEWLVREHNKAAHKWQKEQHDCKASGGKYEVGEWVWLHFPAVLRGRSPKLHWPWTGPFVVIEVLSDVTYWVHSEKPKPGCPM